MELNPTIFHPPSAAEIAERKVKYAKIMLDKWVESFMKRKGIRIDDVNRRCKVGGLIFN